MQSHGAEESHLALGELGGNDIVEILIRDGGGNAML